MKNDQYSLIKLAGLDRIKIALQPPICLETILEYWYFFLSWKWTIHPVGYLPRGLNKSLYWWLLLFFSFYTAFWRYNQHTINCKYLKYTIWYILTYEYTCETPVFLYLSAISPYHSCPMTPRQPRFCFLSLYISLHF